MYLKTEIVETEHQGYRKGKLVTVKRKKKVFHLKCDNCGKNYTREKGRMDEKRLNGEYSHYCPECPTYSLAAKKSNALRKQRTLKQIGKIRFKEWAKYPEIYVGWDYPYYRGNGDGYWMREHIYVMSEYLESKIPKGMVVHHIDNDRMNNNIENLHLCTIDEHNKCHGRIESLVFELVRAKLVEFNKETMDYELSNKLKGLL